MAIKETKERKATCFSVYVKLAEFQANGMKRMYPQTRSSHKLTPFIQQQSYQKRTN